MKHTAHNGVLINWHPRGGWFIYERQQGGDRGSIIVSMRDPEASVDIFSPACLVQTHENGSNVAGWLAVPGPVTVEREGEEMYAAVREAEVPQS